LRSARGTGDDVLGSVMALMSVDTAFVGTI
jgi:hypothetical protein